MSGAIYIPEASILLSDSPPQVRPDFGELRQGNSGHADRRRTGCAVTGYKVQYRKDGAGTRESWEHTGTVNVGRHHRPAPERPATTCRSAPSPSWERANGQKPAPAVPRPLVVQITAAPDITGGNDATFTITLSKAATDIGNLSHEWIGGYRNSRRRRNPGLRDTKSRRRTRCPPCSAETRKQQTAQSQSTSRRSCRPKPTWDFDGSTEAKITQVTNIRSLLRHPSNRSASVSYKSRPDMTDGMRYGMAVTIHRHQDENDLSVPHHVHRPLQRRLRRGTATVPEDVDRLHRRLTRSTPALPSGPVGRRQLPLRAGRDGHAAPVRGRVQRAPQRRGRGASLVLKFQDTDGTTEVGIS